MKISRRFCIFAALVCIAVLVPFEIFRPAPFSSENLNKSFFTIITRLIGAALFLLLNIYLEHDILKPKYAFSRRALWALPCLIVAINNLPSVALLRGDAKISGGALDIILFALECLFVSLFEELAFRGVAFLSILKMRQGKKWLFASIIISSVVFGLFHMVNLIYGAGFGETALQMGYSALVGAMCAFALYKTGSIWICVLIHSVYNFCGQIVPRLGDGEMLNAPQIIITVIISVICAIYIVLSLIKAAPTESDRLYKVQE